mmetsp:Transcript_1261/g.3771  ORF Transcript_1261/g.3771 Transcript_1261/m.3771 type:complete len:585 (+) Transcript_1261:304-2058(+)
MSAYFVPTRFVWRFGGQQVHLCGSFTRWVETMPMAPVDGAPDTFAVVVHLPPGYHQYKFIVDGDWRHDESQPYMPDPLGNVNNWLFVRRQDGSHPSPGAGAQDAAAAAQQAQQSAPQHPPALAGGQPAALTAAHLADGARSGDLSQHSHSNAASAGGTVAGGGDSDTQMAESPAEDGSAHHNAPIVVQADDPAYTRKRVKEFLAAHTAYELIPESGKVVLLDAALPIRQAFHALHEQGIASAPLWDAETATVPGMISASDFIQVLQSLRTSATSSGPLSEAEMDRHSLKGLRAAAGAEGRPPKPLVFVRPGDPLAVLVQRLFAHRCSMAPIVSGDPAGGGEVCTLLTVATLGGVLACLLRHFRASLASLPLLGQPLGRLPLGTWSADSPYLASQGAAGATPPTVTRSADGVAVSDSASSVPHENGGEALEERRDTRKVRRLATVTPTTPLTAALSMLLQAGVSALPVLDEGGGLVDIYARADITALAAANAYNRLQWEDVTVGQALSLGAGRGGEDRPARDGEHRGDGMNGKPRFHCVNVRDPLRAIVERLAQPGVRRLIVIDPETRRLEGIVSLSDIAAYLLL